MGKFWDELKLGLRDQAVGAMKYGASTSYGHNRDAMMAAKREREERERRSAARYPAPTRKGGWYSTNRGGKVELFIGPDGDITAERPHVHVVHDEPNSEVVFIVTRADGSHPTKTKLPGTASGNEVNAMIARLIQEL